VDIPSCSSRQIIKVAVRLGFSVKPGGKGSHTKLEHTATGKVLVVPGTKDVGRGLRTRLIKDMSSITGKSTAEIIRLLSFSGWLFFDIIRKFFQ